MRALLVVRVLAVALTLAACKERHAYVAPPPPKVTVAPAVRQTVTRYLETTGAVVAVNAVDLFARVSGFVQDVGFADGASVRKGDTLFTIEPLTYELKLQQAQAQEAQQQALSQQAEADYRRQSELGRTDSASRQAVEQALANRDSARAQVQQAQAATRLAAITYTYTRVTAPFDGIATAHLVSVGDLVGEQGPTKLASVVQLDPVYVTFNIAERDVLLVRAALASRGKTIRDVGSIPVEAGLQTEAGTPHAGTLDYVSPGVDPSTGTLSARGVFENRDRALLPGFFVRVRVPLERDVPATLVPDVAVAADQGGRYVLVVRPDNTVEQRAVAAGGAQGALRIIDSGLKPGEQVVVGGAQRAVPGQPVSPSPAAAAATASPAG